MAHQIETPGHESRAQRRQLAFFAKLLKMGGFEQRTLLLPTGVRMAYRIGRPRATHFSADVASNVEHGKYQLNFDVHFDGDPSRAPALSPRGSILLLHPWSMDGSSLATWALLFSDAGYVVVVPDLRSQGDSADAPVGYGPREAQDIVALAHELRQSGQLPGPLYLMGASYGGTVAMFSAPDLPDMRGVIALEPYANAAAVIRRAPSSQLFGHPWVSAVIGKKTMDKAIARASRQLGVDLIHLDAGDALARAPVCTLIVRGSRDELTTEEDMRRLAARTSRAVHAELAHENHMTLPLRTDRLFQPILQWMKALPDAGSTACPTFEPKYSKAAQARGAAAT
ncbi:MAG TPA: alpha/beta fold hydrolase [Rhodanobacter sp.]